MKNVLFVCSGNVYRSQVAACLFNKMFTGNKAASAGLKKPHFVTVGDAFRSNNNVDATIAFLKRNRIYIMKNVRRKVTYNDVKSARIVFVMERSQKKKLAKRFPKFGSKIFLLGEFAKQSESEVVDPVVLDLKTSARAYNQIRAALEAIKKKNLLKSLS